MELEQLWETLLSNMYDCTSYNDMPISLIIHEFKKCDDGDYILRATGQSGLVGQEDELLLDGVVPVEVVSVSLFDEDGELSDEEDDICERGEECIIRVTPESDIDEDSIFYLAEECSDVEDLFDCDSYIQDVEELTGIEIDKDELLEGAVDIFSIVFNTFSIIRNEDGDDEEDGEASSNSSTGYQNTIIKTNNMEIDKSEIKYVVGIDLGHGETSAALCPLQWDSPESQWEAPTDIEMGNNRKVIPSAITVLPDGRAFIGDKAFDPEILKHANSHVCFKQKPVNLNGEPEKLMIRFMREVYNLIRENTSGILNDTNHLVYIATPSGWDTASQKLYKEMAKQAGMPIFDVTKESRAAYIRGLHNPASGLSQNVRNGAIVFDMGSSTLDFTYLSDKIERPIDFGYDCGASYIEKFMYGQKRKEEGVRLFEERYPDLAACLLFEARNVKEQVYFNPGMKVKKNIHLDEIVEDDDLDETVKFLYQPNELNDQLEQNGYLKQIEDAMRDFVNRHINNAPIYGVFLTGGASRMDFIIPLVSKCFGVNKESISRDQDPSLTISQGVAEVARMDIRTSGADEGIEEMINSLVEDDRIFDTFVDKFAWDLYDSMTDEMGSIVVGFGESDDDYSLNDLSAALESQVEESIEAFSEKVPEYIGAAINEHTGEIQKKVEDIVSVYSKQGIAVTLPRLEVSTNIQMDSNMSEVIHDISSAIAAQSSDWKSAIADAIALLLRGPLRWLIGGAALLGKLFFSESEEEKKEKAMNTPLDITKRIEVAEKIKGQWQTITGEIQSSVYSEVSGNTQIKQEIQKSVRMLLGAYKQELKNARILVD